MQSAGPWTRNYAQDIRLEFLLADQVKGPPVVRRVLGRERFHVSS